VLSKESLNKPGSEADIPSGAKEVPEKGLKSHEEPEEQASGAKALVDFAALAARLKSCPDTSCSSE
jgi:hypothetical protein